MSGGQSGENYWVILMEGGSAAGLGTPSARVSRFQGFSPPGLWSLVPGHIPCFGKHSIVPNQEFGSSPLIKINRVLCLSSRLGTVLRLSEDLPCFCQSPSRG